MKVTFNNCSSMHARLRRNNDVLWSRAYKYKSHWVAKNVKSKWNRKPLFFFWTTTKCVFVCCSKSETNWAACTNEDKKVILANNTLNLQRAFQTCILDSGGQKRGQTLRITTRTESASLRGSLQQTEVSKGRYKLITFTGQLRRPPVMTQCRDHSHLLKQATRRIEWSLITSE